MSKAEDAKTITKKHLITFVAKQTGMAAKDAEKVIDALLLGIKNYTDEGKDVLIKNFGNFTMVEQDAKQVNMFGKEVIVREKKVLKFQMARRWKAALRGSDDLALFQKVLREELNKKE